MKRVLIAFLAAIMLLSAAACSSKAASGEPTSSPEAVVSAPVIASAEPAVTQEPEPVVTSLLNETGRKNNSFDIAVTLDTNAHSLDILQSLTYVNKTGEELSEIYFNLIPQAFRADGGGVSMGEIRISDTECSPAEVDGTVYRLSLPSPLAAGESVEISMQYTVSIPNIKNRFGYQENVYNLGNFIATPAVFENGSWALEPYVDLGDAFYTEISDYRVGISVPDGYKVAASGTETDGVYIARDVRDFAFCASDGFEVLSDEQDGIELCLYYSAGYEKTAARTLDTAKKSLKLFNSLFGGYPYERLCFVINGLTGGVNGMEYPGLIMLSPDIPIEEFVKMGFAEDSDDVKMALDDSDRATCHKIAHQWFYGIVGNDQISSPWLDEGMCRFAEYLYEKANPPYAPNDGYPPMEDRIKSEIAQVTGEGGIDGMDYAPDTTDLNWSLYDWATKSPMEYGGIYMKGAALLYQMEQKLGEAAFLSGLKEYVKAFAYDKVTTEEFEEFWASKGDFSDLFAVYLKELGI